MIKYRILKLKDEVKLLFFYLTNYCFYECYFPRKKDL